MLEICKLLSVKRGIDTADAENSVLVEKCKQYDVALTGYSIVCPKENLPEVLAWVTENMKDISDYIKGTFEGDNPAFGFTLIRSTLNVNSFTQEFVENCGSVQAFLDKYGVSPSLEFSEKQTPEEKVETPFLAQETQTQGETLQPESVPIPKSLMKDYGESEQQDLFENDFEDTSNDFGGSAQTNESVSSIFTTGTAEEPADSVIEEPVSEETTEVKLKKEPVEKEPVSAETEEEEETVEEKAISGEETDASLDFQGDKVILDPEEIYEVECDGIDIPALQFRNGKVIVPFSHLSELVKEVLLASSAIEQKDADGFEILTTDSKFAAAKIVERYAPTVVKEFVLSYVIGAESDADLVRITKMLNEFCTFVAEKKILSFNREAV